jgi:diaminopimelate epimerase
MTLQFTKMNGAGNDFVLLDNRDGAIGLSAAQVRRLCHRQRGIGADGVLLLVPCGSGRADWAWQFFNSDGSEADMCGNGARCFARYLHRRLGAAGDSSYSFETGAGVIHGRVTGKRVAVTLTEPKNLALNQTVDVHGQRMTIHSLDTGVPHAVLFVPDADAAMVAELGPAIRHHPHFAPRGTNVNFVQVRGPSTIRVRTYERGVEGETLACGTGVTAAALIASVVHRQPAPVRVQVQGGDTLEVGFTAEGSRFSEVTLTGPAEFVFEGRIELD